VDRFQDIAEGMKSRGYEGIFQRRTGDTRDGCAMFWKSKRLHLLEEDSIDFSEFNLRNNVAQICVFEVLGLALVFFFLNRGLAVVSSRIIAYMPLLCCKPQFDS